MIIYNVTIKVSWAIHDAWVDWMINTHMPDVMATGCFTRNQLVKVLELDEEEGPTYAAQYYANEFSDYERYINQHSQTLREDGYNKWGNNFIAFRSVMEIVN